MWLTVVSTPGPYLGPWGIYAPSNVTGAITWTGGAPFADASLHPSIEVWNNATTGAQAFTVALTVKDASGAVVGTATGGGTTTGAVTTWSSAAPIFLPKAALWHLVGLPLVPALYSLAVSLTVGGVAVDAEAVTFGVRTATFDADTGFWLNGLNIKILGNANHQVRVHSPRGGICSVMRTVPRCIPCIRTSSRLAQLPPLTRN